MSKIEFRQRWREELESIADEGILVFEFTIGQKHVYFPDHTRWLAKAPDWAKGKWEEYSNACIDWCKKERVPISFVNDANFYEEKIK